MQWRTGQVGAGWLLVGVALIAALAWWHTRETPERTRAKQQRAERAAAEIAEDARPVLYRWRGPDGVVQFTDQPPPPGVKYTKIDQQPRDGATVDGRVDDARE